MQRTNLQGRHATLLIALGFFLLLVKSTVSFAACEDLPREIDALSAEIDTSERHLAKLDNLFHGQVIDLGPNIDLVNVPLDLEKPIELAVDKLSREIDLLDEVINLPQQYEGCGAAATQWLSQKTKATTAHSSLLTRQLTLLNKPRSVRLVLLRALTAWQGVTRVQQQLSQTLSTKPNQPSLAYLAASEQLQHWIVEYQLALETWLPELLDSGVNSSRINASWQKTLQISPVSTATDWQTLNIEQPDTANDWRTLLEESRSSLVLSSSKWRNETIWQLGWRSFITDWVNPRELLSNILAEITSAPRNFADNLSRPFIREYRRQVKQAKSGQLLTNWFIQAISLVLMVLTLIKSAELSPHWVSSLQQNLVNKISNNVTLRLLSALFWVFKPHTPWLVMIFGAYIVNTIIPKEWTILSGIVPIAALYALFRAVRVIAEWLLSRTYSRGDDFLPFNTASQIVQDSQRFSWGLVICWLILWLAQGTGGGYVLYIVALGVMVISWWLLFWLMSRHAKAVNRFMSFVAGKKVTGDTPGDTLLQTIGIKWFWPALFLLAHTFDVFRSANQKLMVFDVYRSLSVKLMRVRLESKADDLDENDEGEPDENYSDWMLRKVNDDALLDIGDSTKALEPLKRWLNDKTNENILMVVGETGSGKTTFLRRLPLIWQESDIQYIDVSPKTTTSQEVFAFLSKALGCEPFDDLNGLIERDQSMQPRIVVIDSAHNLFLTEVGYFEAYKTFMQCMNAHLENIFWVVAVHSPSWVYLSCVFSREQRISNIYRMPRWTPMEIRKLILSRHKGARRRLRYNELLLSAAASSESSSVRAADSRVFNILWEQSGGNPLAALELWLNASKVTDRVVEIGVPQRPSVAELSKLKDDLHFIYAAIVSHHSLSTHEIMLVTHFSEPIVHHALKQGINLGLITRDSSNRYTVDPLWYGTLSSLLQRKNMLWS